MCEQDEHMRKTVSDYGDIKESYQQERLVELLRDVQEIYGCIPEDVQDYISGELQVKPVVIRSLLKYFPSLHSAKRHKITLCTGPECSKKGSQSLEDVIREEIRRMRSRKSKVLFTFTVQNCLKSCRTAPNLKIDGQIYTGVKPEDIKKILEQYT